MNRIVLDGHYSKGHSCWAPTPISASARKTFINGLAVALDGDIHAPHVCKNPPQVHAGGARAGIATVKKTYIEGKKVLREGDRIVCGDTCQSSSSVNVYIE